MDKLIEEIKKKVIELRQDVLKNKEKSKDKSIRDIVKNSVNKDLGEAIKNNVSVISDRVFGENSSKTLIVVSEAVGMLLKVNGISSSQLRNIFGYVKKIEAGIDVNAKNLKDDEVKKLLLLSPKLAYVIGKETGESKETLEIFRNLLVESVNEVENDKNKFKTFVNLFESILSFHKYYGGKE